MFERAILYLQALFPNIRKESGISENRHFTKEIQYHKWQIFVTRQHNWGALGEDFNWLRYAWVRGESEHEEGKAENQAE
jgi:hypothetical protein